MTNLELYVLVTLESSWELFIDMILQFRSSIGANLMWMRSYSKKEIAIEIDRVQHQLTQPLRLLLLITFDQNKPINLLTRTWSMTCM